MQSTGQGSKKIVKCALLFALLLATGATAHAKISVNPSPMKFGSQTVGVASPSMAVALTNNTLSNIKIVRVSLAPIQFSYSGASLPITLRPGQSLIAAVTFTPTAAQAYPGTLTFTRANGKTVTDNLGGLGIQTTVQSPQVTTQPSSQTITAGQTATFAVTATGTAPLSYQWSQNGTAISGATSSSLHHAGGNDFGQRSAVHRGGQQFGGQRNQQRSRSHRQSRSGGAFDHHAAV